MKKIMLVFFALVVFSLPFQQTYIETNAAVASKVATLSAKKVAKEVIQDAAVETAANFALMQALEIVGDYEAKPGFKIVCPDGSQSCDKPIQVKENITDMDKQAIKGQAGLELDKMINNGKAIPKWQKFLDWFLPVWLVTFGATVLTYALDSDVRSFFNETGYNALVALGFIVPLTEKQVIPIEDVPIPVEQPDGTYETDGKKITTFGKVLSMPEGSKNPLIGSVIYTTSLETTNWNNVLVNINIKNDEAVDLYSLSFRRSTSSFYEVAINRGTTARVVMGSSFYMPDSDRRARAVIQYNGQTVHTQEIGVSGSDWAVSATELNNPELYSIMSKKLRSIQTRSPYEIDGFWYTDALFNTVDGNVWKTQLQTDTVPNLGKVTKSEIVTNYRNNTDPNNNVSVVVHTDIRPKKEILPPLYEEVEQDGSGLIQKSNYEDDKGRVAIIPPSAVPLEEEGTGQQVIRVPASNGDGYEFQKPDGTIVPEENVTTGPDPVVTPSPGGQTYPNGEPIPQGTPTVTPTPTPTAPNPQPIPLTPDATAPPGTPPGEEPPAEPFPEGEKCDAKLQFPIFSPLKETFSTAFPFSIPWDIERAINAAFGGISDEKPGFILALPFMGEEWQMEITTPAMFDKWKPFTDTFLLLTFDVLIMFGIFRFVKGAGS